MSYNLCSLSEAGIVILINPGMKHPIVLQWHIEMLIVLSKEAQNFPTPSICIYFKNMN